MYDFGVLHAAMQLHIGPAHGHRLPIGPHGAHSTEPARVHVADLRRQLLVDVDGDGLRGGLVPQLVLHQRAEGGGSAVHGDRLVPLQPVRGQAASQVHVGGAVLVGFEEEDAAQQRD